MQKVLFLLAKISLFCIKVLASVVGQKSTFLQRKPESGSFGHRHSHQDYQGVLNTVCTQRWCLETNIYIIYTFEQPTFAELQNVNR
jgi:glycogen synthase